MKVMSGKGAEGLPTVRRGNTWRRSKLGRDRALTVAKPHRLRQRTLARNKALRAGLGSVALVGNCQ